MSTYKLPGFGDIDLNSLNSDYEGETSLNGKVVTLDLNFDEDQTDIKTLDRIKDFIENLPNYNDIAIKAQKKDFDSEGEVRDHIYNHVDLTEDDDEDVVSKKQNDLLATVHLKRVGFYPENDDQFAVFDYTIGRDLTDYLIVVNFQKSGHIDSLTMES